MKTILSFLLLSSIYMGSFAQDNVRKSKVKYGRNIISFMPLYAISDNYVGVGGSYEFLANDYIGIRMPVMAAINEDYINVGLELKMYPGRNNGAVRYAIAPMITYGTGNQSINGYIYDPISGQYIYTTKVYNRQHFGFLLNQTLNCTIMQNFYIGMDGGLGINYYDNKIRNTNNNFNNNNSNISFIAQFHVMMGVRF